jgi:hypothetical protein
MISTDGGETKLALSEGQPQGSERPIGIRRIAFRIGGDDFVKLIEELDALKGNDAIKRSEIADHGRSSSAQCLSPIGQSSNQTLGRSREPPVSHPVSARHVIEQTPSGVAASVKAAPLQTHAF